MNVTLSNRQRKIIRGVIRREYKATVDEASYLMSKEKILETIEIVGVKGPLTTEDRLLEFGSSPVMIVKSVPKQKIDIEKAKSKQSPVLAIKAGEPIKKSDYNRVVAMYNKSKSKKLVNISAKIQESHEMSLKEIAIQQDRTVSWLVRKAIEEYVERNK